MQDSSRQIVLTHPGDTRDEQTRTENARALKLLVHCLPAKPMVRILERFVHGFLESRDLGGTRQDVIKDPEDGIVLVPQQRFNKSRKRAGRR